MKDKFLLMCISLQNRLESEEGQDLIEYALVVALIALGATAGMNSVATAVGSAFSSLGALVSHAGGLVIH